MEENSDNSVFTRGNSIQSISISTISNEVVEEEVRINVQETSNKRKKENKIHPFNALCSRNFQNVKLRLDFVEL